MQKLKENNTQEIKISKLCFSLTLVSEHKIVHLEILKDVQEENSHHAH